MNQQTPPPNHSDGDSRPDDGTAPERIERPSNTVPTEPSPSAAASSATASTSGSGHDSQPGTGSTSSWDAPPRSGSGSNSGSDPRPGAGRPDEPRPHPEALAGWEEPQPEIDEVEPRTSGRWNEPSSSGGPSSGGPSTGGPGSAGPSSSGSSWEEPRPSGEQYRTEGTREPRRRHPAEEHFFSKRTWTRLLFVVLFAIAWWIAEFVLTAVVVIQFLWALFTGEPNEKLRAFGQSLSRYAYQIFRYMTFNSDQRPFPFDLDWPSGAPDSTSS